MTDAEVFLAAADVIRERGWHQGDVENDLGEVCVVGAIKTVLYGDAHYTRRDRDLRKTNSRWGWLSCRLIEYIRKEYGVDADTYVFASDWNDDPRTTVEDVILGLKGMAHVG